MDAPIPPKATAEAPSLATAARWIVVLVGAYFLLRELGPILKPLFLAILIGYIILPIHLAVKKRVPGRLSLVASAILSLFLILATTAAVQATISTLSAEIPTLNAEALRMKRQFLSYIAERYPHTSEIVNEYVFADGEASVRDLTTRSLGAAANTVTSTAIVMLYLLFLLLEAGRFPDRVRHAFSDRRAERILQTIEGINRGIAHYLGAKVKASFILAIPVFIILFVFSTPFALIWALLTFFCNFVPYLGSLIAYTIPALFALVSFGFGWEFLTIAIALLAIHVLSASLIEPAMIGKAVGLSPVIVLLALAFWGSIWGLTGMLLAVPLTVMLKIVAEHLDATRPLAKLVAAE